MTLAEAIDRWLAHKRALMTLGQLRPRTLAVQEGITRTLATHMGATPLADLRKSHIDLFVAARLQTCAPVTVHQEAGILKALLNWCVDEGLLTQRPRFPTVQVPNSEPPLPDEAVFRRVIDALPERHARALAFMQLTGLSPHELERLQVRDAKPHPDAIKRRVIGAPAWLHIGGRADFHVKQPSRRRWVPLSGPALELWRAAIVGREPTDSPFPSVAAMQKAIQRLDLAERVTPKMMRKWFASKIATEQPEHVLQRLLGHAPGSPITRKHYVRSSDEQLARAVEGVNP